MLLEYPGAELLRVALRHLTGQRMPELPEPRVRIAPDRKQAQLRLDPQAGVLRALRAVGDGGARRAPEARGLAACDRARRDRRRPLPASLDAPTVVRRHTRHQARSGLGEGFDGTDELHELGVPPAVLLLREAPCAVCGDLGLERGELAALRLQLLEQRARARVLYRPREPAVGAFQLGRSLPGHDGACRADLGLRSR